MPRPGPRRPRGAERRGLWGVRARSIARHLTRSPGAYFDDAEACGGLELERRIASTLEAAPLLDEATRAAVARSAINAAVRDDELTERLELDGLHTSEWRAEALAGLWWSLMAGDKLGQLAS